ncbi:MAG TPA: LPS export ABC transporter periplasmic protein LptC [Burkholderiales bacterium]|nr:LPS export ABC transporter periplasmic protein LptC [Burkholderiales bacterium]
MRRSRISSLFPLLLMLALAAGSFWLERAVQLPQPDQSGRLRHDPDFIADDLDITQMNAAGHPEYVLSAARMTHYPDDDSTDVLAPRLVQRQDKASPITMRSDRGLILSRGKEVKLYGNVLVVRMAGKGEGEMRVQTEYLDVFPDRDFARTDKAVLITQDKSRLSGVGMEFNNKTQQLALLSQVRGSFDVAK